MEIIENTKSNEGAFAPELVDLNGAKNAQIMGVISIVWVFCTCCYGGVISLVLGFIAFNTGKKAIAEYEANPSLYSEKSFNQAKTGKTTGLIGIILGVLAVLYIILSLIFNIGSAIISNPVSF